MSVIVACTPREGIIKVHLYISYAMQYWRKSKIPTEDDEDGPALKGKVVKFGWLEGVLMRCILNIWGVMLFLRLSWVIGHAGVLEGFLLISLANLVTFITAFSMSAVSTNGQIKGGGIYYMISRSLGPEFGAAIGLMFTVANSIAVSMYIVGFCESLNDLLKANDLTIIDGGSNDIRVVGIGVLIAILVLAFVGMDWVTRTQMFLLVVLIAAQVDFIVGSFIGPVDDEERAKGFIEYNAATFATNFWADYRTDYGAGDTQQSFFSAFGVFFPAVTGIVAGANLSGDLKDPASAIPKGTLLAITITYITYILYAVMMGGCALREATGNETQYILNMNATFMEENPDFLLYTDCKDGLQTCDYGMLNSAQVMELISSWGPLIYMGCFAATLSSAIASLVGAPRVFQALCKDKLYPVIHFFAKGYGANNDPVRGYILVFIISLGCLLIAELNAIAPLLSNFFLMAYFLINFSCFHATVTKSPGWRPAFKYYNAWVSLVGCVLCIAVMFLMSWVTALITVACVIFLYLYVAYRKPEVNWGSSTQAQSYNSALKSIQDLNVVEEHVKNYRPQLLVLSGMPSSRPPLIDFANLIVKNLSLMLCAQVVKGSYNQKVRNALSRQAYNWLAKHKKKGFYTMIEDESFERGCRSIMQICGLGKLRPNTVLMGYKTDWQRGNRQELKEYFNVIHEALDMYLGVAILRVQEGLDYTGVIEDEDQATPQQILLDMKKDKEKGIVRNQSESQLSQDGTSSEASSPPSSPKIERSNPAGPTGETAVGLKKRQRKHSLSALYAGPNGSALPRDVISHLTQFQRKQKKGTIDVWWLYDDGGLTLLLPYILTSRSQFSGCALRIFSLASKKDELGREQRNMAALLSKFRIDYSDVIVIPDVTKKAHENTKKEFDAVIAPFKSNNSDDGTSVTEAELIACREKTNRHLRLRELLLTHSKESTFIVMTLPMPRKGTVSAPLYMAWLEMMTKGMPPFLMIRGNQTSVLTFYS
ncbi:Bumetanide-sensitive sodium-(potassium)-chloride cotransporter [Orchesella cincta]|uniref:Bumetanide-sensitive sodium-(Potassium)-chloride cotransporter n=1 Tax=Orchesella cincta TaxID=48709 RepID=A0A1D2MZB1_ORCCI|nr:Bumetanide-sensitive sodium-(potassium)-chloride cotransporter [Orchesella cincta]